ncbi:hypothetical protein [Paenibacillus wulumuqiensis]|uniref:hypothetical protein n=1 Tax=Paenibacillus wulumuqiensis TaxID=1567107 RepID=UPI000619A754|nr:hypothetical protein [Paenibacillus wulumuqiensis]
MPTISQLLDQYKMNFPTRMEARVQELVSTGMIEMEARSHIRLKIAPGIQAEQIPTLDKGVLRPVSPQLLERFAYAGSWLDLGEHMLDPVQMKEVMNGQPFREWIAAMRDNREDSAPARYPDDRLSVLSVISEDDGEYTLLVWPEDKSAEPRVYRYYSQQEQQFEDLADWLRWMNGMSF